MGISLYDVILLNNGLKAQIVEILQGGECYVVDVEESHGWDDDDTIFAMPEEIIANLGTWREADRFRCVMDADHLIFPDKYKAFTHLVFEEDVPRGWRKVIVNGTEHEPVFATMNTAEHRNNWLVIEGLHEYKGMIVEFV